MKGNFEEVFKQVVKEGRTCFYNPHTGVINQAEGQFVQSSTYKSSHVLPEDHDSFKTVTTAAFNYKTLEELWELNVSLGFIVDDNKVLNISLYHHFNNPYIAERMARQFGQDHYYRCMGHGGGKGQCFDYIKVYLKK